MFAIFLGATVRHGLFHRIGAAMAMTDMTDMDIEMATGPAIVTCTLVIATGIVTVLAIGTAVTETDTARKRATAGAGTTTAT